MDARCTEHRAEELVWDWELEMELELGSRELDMQRSVS